jgi:hypothetical protein
MDILNFISWIRGRRQVTSVDPTKTLIPVGLKDGRRDDEYLAGAISVEDLATQIAPPPTPSVNIYNSNGTLTGNRTVNCAGNGLVMINSAGYTYNGNGFSIAASTGSFNMSSGGFSTGIIYQLQNSIVGGPLLTLGKYQGAGVLLNLKFDHIQNVAGFSDGRTDQAFTYNGLKVNIANRLYQFGQITGSNTTNITIDDAAAYPVQVSGTNVAANTAGAASGQFLKIKVNGVDYKIALLNP